MIVTVSAYDESRYAISDKGCMGASDDNAYIVSGIAKMSMVTIIPTEGLNSLAAKALSFSIYLTNNA